jgi:hypothetical protein
MSLASNILLLTYGLPRKDCTSILPALSCTCQVASVGALTNCRLTLGDQAHAVYLALIPDLRSSRVLADTSPPPVRTCLDPFAPKPRLLKLELSSVHLSPPPTKQLVRTYTGPSALLPGCLCSPVWIGALCSASVYQAPVRQTPEAVLQLKSLGVCQALKRRGLAGP